ncbi:DUF5994 family protein [Nonomuraea sp. NPDC050536]|uniref:DUF5994 family protein n=1 Tax=Nonomuraea sp. NPDC050536 TaxID=3364366 RepID=UPI0037C56E21
MKPTLLSHLKPLSAIARAAPTTDSAVRLCLNPVLDRRAVVDGAWWPRSRDAAAELPSLIAAVDQRLDQITVGVGIYRDAWYDLPHRIPARGRRIQVSCFHRTDPRVITLIPSVGKPIVLLIIEPNTTSGAAALTAQDTTGLSPADIITIPPFPAPSPADADTAAKGENEGRPSADHTDARRTGQVAVRGFALPAGRIERS